jgi:hypothetical protein
MLRDLDCKKTKLSLRMLTLSWMSPSYPSGTPVSSAGGRGLSLPIAFTNRLLGKKKLHPLLPVGASIYLSTPGPIYLSAIAEYGYGLSHLHLNDEQLYGNY